MRKIFYKTDELIAVDSPKIGEKYHLSWAKKNGMVWVLTSIIGNDAIMMTPKTKKILRAKVSELRHLRKNQQKIEQTKVDVSKIILKHPIMIYEHKSTPEKD